MDAHRSGQHELADLFNRSSKFARWCLLLPSMRKLSFFTDRTAALAQLAYNLETQHPHNFLWSHLYWLGLSEALNHYVGIDHLQATRYLLTDWEVPAGLLGACEVHPVCPLARVSALGSSVASQLYLGVDAQFDEVERHSICCYPAYRAFNHRSELTPRTQQDYQFW